MIRGVLFDLDGTLLDSAPDLIGTLNELRQLEGMVPLEVAALQQHVSRGAVGILNAGLPELDAHRFEDYRQRFLLRYAQRSYVDSSLYEGASEVLQYLQQAAIPWGVVTNKSEALTQPILRQAELSPACVVCGDTLAVNKPDPAPVELACTLLGVEPAQTLMIGDDLRDLQAGQAAGTYTAFAAYGYATESEPRGVRCDVVFEQLKHLPDWLQQQHGNALT